MAAAVTLAQAGLRVTVWETSRNLGGRARAVLGQRANGTEIVLDNGQHILIGAYGECLRLMRLVGVDTEEALLRLPLALVFPDETGLTLPDAPAPWDALAGIARARSWSWRARAALLARAAHWQWAGFRCADTATVADLCAGLPVQLLREFIDPLCVSALNTPAASACGTTFLRVLQDALFSGRGGSNLLLPRVDLGALWPVPAAQWLRERGHSVQVGQRVPALVATAEGQWQVNGMLCDAVVVATGSAEAARLATGTDMPAAHSWAKAAAALDYAAIATVYVEVPETVGPLLPRPMLALRSGAQHPAQFVFDRGLLDGTWGILAFVVSAFVGTRQALETQVLAQAAQQLHLTGLHILQTVVEKRATFVCTPQLARPPMQIAPGLLACGDYVAGPYPATLEGAMLHGTAAAKQLIDNILPIV